MTATRTILAAALLSAATVTAASAQDGGRFSWSGLYLGVHGGYADGEWDLDLNSKSVHALQYNQHFSAPTRTDLSGGFGGLQAGLNHQVGPWVIGIEADVSWARLASSDTFNTAPTAPPAYNACSYGPKGCTDWKVGTTLDMFGTVRGRTGYAYNGLLIYGTGGFAWGRTEATYDATDAMPGAPFEMFRLSGKANHFGWTAGGGVEWMFAPNFTVRAEYLYIDLGQADYALSGVTRPGGTIPWNDLVSADLQFHVIRAGLNWRFNTP